MKRANVISILLAILVFWILTPTAPAISDWCNWEAAPDITDFSLTGFDDAIPPDYTVLSLDSEAAWRWEADENGGHVIVGSDSEDFTETLLITNPIDFADYWEENQKEDSLRLWIFFNIDWLANPEPYTFTVELFQELPTDISATPDATVFTKPALDDSGEFYTDILDVASEFGAFYVGFHYAGSGVPFELDNVEVFAEYYKVPDVDCPPQPKHLISNKDDDEKENNGCGAAATPSSPTLPVLIIAALAVILLRRGKTSGTFK